ncbi:MAG: type II toxin-antitoxin system RelE/ParE family toxin [Acidisphaera sp.]|nr:type II toxin-antitoxin system RelE/ParE family toxin [Acidisphaera sp.]
MPRRLRYTDEARDDLEGIRCWLTQPGSGSVARRRLAALRTTIEQLRTHPCRYPVGRHRGVRELPCPGGYRAPYEVAPDTGRDADAGDVIVLRVYGPGQDRSGFGGL